MKGLALVILICSLYLAEKNISQVIRDYNDYGNYAAIRQLTLSKEDLNNALVLNSTLLPLMLVSFLIDAFTLRTPLRETAMSKYTHS